MDESSPIYHLPQDTLHHIFSNLPLRQIIRSRSVCKLFNETLSSPSFIQLVSTQQPPLRLLALRPPHHHNRHVIPNQTLHAFDPDQSHWLNFPLTFLPFRSPQPVASSLGLVYLWAESPDSTKTLLACNPLTREFRVLPQLGSAWSKHGSVLVGPPNRVIVLSELAALYFSGETNNWVNFSSNLPSKPRSPILIRDSVLALCDVGSPWRSQWKLFCCRLSDHQTTTFQSWARLEKHEWGDVFEILKRPRLV